jgi:hypothetical protein
VRKPGNVGLSGRSVFAHLVSIFGPDPRGFDAAARVLRLIVGALVVEDMEGSPPTNERLQERMTAKGAQSMATFYRDLRVFKQAFPGEKPSEVAQRFRPYVEMDLKDKTGGNLLSVMDVPWDEVRMRRGRG